MHKYVHEFTGCIVFCNLRKGKNAGAGYESLRKTGSSISKKPFHWNPQGNRTIEKRDLKIHREDH